MSDDQLIAELIRDEGLRLKPYVDTVGKTTLGIGRNVEDRGISEDEALYLARNDIALCKADLDRNAPWWRTLDPVRQRVLVNMCFNMGWPKLAGFKKTLAAMKAGQWDVAAAEMLNSDWSSQVGNRAQRLAQMMRTG